MAARFSARINGFTGIAFTRLDILDTLPVLKICVAYELNGSRIDYFPANAAILERCQPIYEELPGWQTPTCDIRDYDKLPVEARRYIERLEKLIGYPANIISVGSARQQTIHKTPVI